MSVAELNPEIVASTPRLAPHGGAGADRQATRRGDDAVNEVLHDRTFKWLVGLPADVRALATARQYPRILNRIADLWGHCEYSRLHFQSLLIDRRGGRRGFPEEVRQELESLQRYYFEHLAGLPAILWNAVPMTPPRIPDTVFPLPSHKAVIEILPVLRDYEPTHASNEAHVDVEPEDKGLRRLHGFWRRSAGRE